MKINFRNPFLWIVIVLASIGFLGRSQGYDISSPIAVVGYMVLGVILGIAYNGYNRDGWGGVLPEIQLIIDIISGRKR